MQAETNEKKEWMADYTFYQAGTNATLLAIAVWSLTSLGGPTCGARWTHQGAYEGNSAKISF